MRRALYWLGFWIVCSAGPARAEEEPVSPASGFGRRGACLPGCAPLSDPWQQSFPCQPATPLSPGMPPEPTTPTEPPRDPIADRFAQSFATQTGQGALQGRSINEEFDGDNAGVFYRLRINTGGTFQTQQVGTRTQVVIDPRTGQRTTITVPVFGNVLVPTTGTVLVPVAGRYSGVMVTENDSPRPADRIYGGNYYYDGLGRSLNSGIGGFLLNRTMIGFEKTLADGSASVGMRLPFNQLTGPVGLGGDGVGDLTILLKYAAYFDPDRMNFFTFGLAITAPTGPAGGLLADGTTIPHSVLFQPWAGFIRSGERMYMQEITNLIVPTDGRDVVLLGNSFGFGYWLYRGNFDRYLPAITPTAEFHIRTPLTNRSRDDLVFFQDQVNITSGVHFRWSRVTLSGGACVPVVGPRPWNIEAIANVNIWF